MWKRTVVVWLCAFLLGAQPTASTEQQYLLLVLPLIESGDLARAEEQLVAGMKLFPRPAILANALGIVYRRQNKTEQAVAAFERALGWLPSFTAAQLHLASLYQEQGRKREAAELFAAAGENTSNFEALTAAAAGLAQCDDYKRAVTVLEKARVLQPASESVLYNLALAQFKLGNFAAALEPLELIPSGSAHRQADVLYLRGKIREALGRAGSSDDLSTACRLAPQSEAFCLDAGLTLIKNENFVEAAGLLQAGLERSPSSVALLSSLGLAQFRLGRYQEAIATYSLAIERDPALDAAREGLAFLLYMTGDLEKARAVVEHGLKDPAADFYLSQLHAMILYRLSPRLRGEALQAVNRALAAHPRFAPAYFLRGKIAMEAGRIEAALEDFRKAAELDPKYPLPYYKMAQIYLRQGRAREAEAASKKFSELGHLREEELLTKQAQDLLMPGAR